VAGWTFVAADTTGRELGELQGYSRSLSFPLDGPAEARFTIDGRQPTALLADELVSDLIVYRDELKIFRGRIGFSQDQLGPDAHTINFTAHDYRALLDRRILVEGDPYRFTQVDQSAIAWQLIAHSQSKVGGNLGITRGLGATTGRLRDRAYEFGKPIGEIIQELGEVIDGFDWEITPELVFNVYYPQRGNLMSAEMLDWGGTIAGVSRTVTTTEYANVVRVTGRSQGAAPEDPEEEPVELVGEVRTADDIGTVPQGRWEKQIGSDVVTQFGLADRADYELMIQTRLMPKYSLEYALGRWNGPQTLWLGDRPRVRVRSGRLDVSTRHRVQQIDIDVDDNDVETVRVDLGSTPISDTRRAAKVESRLEGLERK